MGGQLAIKILNEWMVNGGEAQRIVQKLDPACWFPPSAGQHQHVAFHQTQILDSRTNLLRVHNIAIIVLLSHPLLSILFANTQIRMSLDPNVKKHWRHGEDM